MEKLVKIITDSNLLTPKEREKYLYMLKFNLEVEELKNIIRKNNDPDIDEIVHLDDSKKNVIYTIDFNSRAHFCSFRLLYKTFNNNWNLTPVYCETFDKAYLELLQIKYLHSLDSDFSELVSKMLEI